MKFYVASDIHGFYTPFREALLKAGFFSDTVPHKLIILGDIFDRGREAKELQAFILELMSKDEAILVKGNHEELYTDLVTKDDGGSFLHHRHNGTYSTALQLTGFDPHLALVNNHDFAVEARRTPFYRKIIPAMINYYETKNYVFVHGWIPCVYERKTYSYCSDWRNASAKEWKKARWYNGIDASVTSQEDKTIMCGHWHTSYAHCRFEGKGSEFGTDADFSPYFGSGIIAIDGCTALSGIVNVLVLEDDEL